MDNLDDGGPSPTDSREFHEYWKAKFLARIKVKKYIVKMERKAKEKMLHKDKDEKLFFIQDLPKR
jgi:hypothetical protein